MASSVMFATATSIICLLSLFQKIEATPITNSEVTNLLSLLNHKIVGNKKPVIIILEKDSGHSLQNKPDLLTSSEEHDPINIPHYLHEKVINSQVIKKSTPSYLNLLQRGQKNRQRPQKNRLIDNKDKEVDKQVLRSAIVKKLLRISNSIRCDAKDNCENNCHSKYKGKRVFTCQVQCEVKYECEEPEKAEDDPCESGCENSCDNSNDCPMSTKGEKLQPEINQCKRC